MATLLRRFVVLTALMFWQGGFLFYASVVVPIGQEVLDSHKEQGFITQRVTNYLNLSGAIALALLAWDIAASRDKSTWRYSARWLCWLGMLATLLWLVWLHPRLDDLLDATLKDIIEHRSFRAQHRTYLWVSTAQWVFGMLFAILTLETWRRADIVETMKAQGPQPLGLNS